MISEETKEKLKYDPAACYIIDENNELLYANEPGTAFCSGAVKGANFIKVLCGKSEPCYDCPLRKRLATEPTYVSNNNLCSFAYVNFSKLQDGLILSRWNEAPDALSCMPEINLEKALEGMDGSREIFDSIAEVYFTEGLTKPDLIMKYYNEKDYYNLRIEVHGLKGTSYVIGAEHLGDFAKKLEFACRDIEANEDEVKVKTAKDMIDNELNDLMMEYKMLLTKLGAIYYPDKEVVFGEKTDSAVEFDANKYEGMKELLLAVKEDIENYDLDESEKKLNDAIKMFDDSAAGEFLQTLLKYQKDFKYDEASKLIDSVTK